MNGVKDGDIVKIQSFIRGCLCRARVSKMVKRLIEDILLERKKATIAKADENDDDEGSRLGRGKCKEDNNFDNETKMLVDTEDDTSSLNALDDEKLNQNSKEHYADNEVENRSTSSIDLMDIMPSDIKETSKSNEIQGMNDILQGSVSEMLSKIEGNRDPKAPLPARNWSPLKVSDKPIKHFQTLVSPSTEKPGLLVEGPKRSSVKNTKLQNNATNRVSSSEKVFQEQVIRMNEEIQQLLKDIRRVGECGKSFVNFGELFDDDAVANYYEALVGTLKAAKKKGLIKYEGQFLLKGFNDKVVISIL